MYYNCNEKMIDLNKSETVYNICGLTIDELITLDRIINRYIEKPVEKSVVGYDAYYTDHSNVRSIKTLLTQIGYDREQNRKNGMLIK